MSSGRILVADDEPSVRESVGYALEQEGFEVTIATDGDDADDKLGSGEVPFDQCEITGRNPLVAPTARTSATYCCRASSPAQVPAGR